MWVSPDGKIRKTIVRDGEWGTKPSDETRCKISLKDCPQELKKYNNTVIIIGDSNGEFGRALDICLMTMHEGELSNFTIDLEGSNISICIELIQLDFKGFIYMWNAKQKYDLVLRHKDQGVNFFQAKDNKEAAFKFVKALKILSIIPIDVQQPPGVIDGVTVEEINALKSSLYNNLSSCFFRNQCWLMVIDLCKKVFIFDSDNVKALYKIGVAYKNDKDFENANKAFMRVLEIEPDNKAAAEQLNYVKAQLQQADIRFNNLVKKMFVDGN